MAPSSQNVEPPQNPGRFSQCCGYPFKKDAGLHGDIAFYDIGLSIHGQYTRQKQEVSCPHSL
jgi:hypothetical protein